MAASWCTDSRPCRASRVTCWPASPLVDPFTRRKRPIGEDILDTVAAVMPQAAKLCCTDAIRELSQGVRRGYSNAGWLRERLAVSGSLQDVVREASGLWARPASVA